MDKLIKNMIISLVCRLTNESDFFQKIGINGCTDQRAVVLESHFDEFAKDSSLSNQKK